MNMTLRKLISERLKTAMDQSGTIRTQSELEKKSGVAQATIGRILRCETDARVDTIHALAQALKKPSAYFLDEKGNENVAPTPKRAARQEAPLISWVKAGEWTCAEDPFLPGEGESWLEVPDSTGPHSFWLRVVGDSMTSPTGLSVPEGSLILVDPDVPADNGRLVVAKLTDSNEVTFKKLIKDGGKTYLRPLNPDYPLIHVTENCSIVGVVVQATQKL
jgi:SOS-response transcriptional repressor LexA